MQKKILINYVCRHGVRYPLDLIRHLVGSGWEVYAVISSNMDNVSKWRNISGIKLYEVDGYTTKVSFLLKLIKFLCSDSIKIRRLICKEKISYELTPMLTYWSYVVYLCCRCQYSIYVMHDPKPHDGRFFLGWLNNQMGKNAQKIVILSRVFREYVISCYRGQISIIPEGVQLSHSKEVIMQYDMAKVNFIFQGTADKYKGLSVLASAYRAIRRKRVDVTLTIAVSRNFEPYRQLFEGLEGCRVLNRWFTDEEVNGFFNDKNTVCILPYISATQSGVIPVAMMNGSPIIASACGGIPEQIEDGVTGWLVTPGDVQSLVDKMEYVINHRDEWARIRNAANEHIKSLDWANIAKQFGEFILE